ncbi:MAG: lipocalin family protein [Pseudomonadota bacterium]|nr:lipocalin family protein [Pseudomonadota bacterium]
MRKQSLTLLVFSFAFTSLSHANSNALHGIWAMVPLKSGIANVVEFTADTATVHSFECYAQGQSDSSADPETTQYSLSDQTIALNADGQPVGTLEIKALSATELTLFQAIDGMPNGGSSFTYRKATEVKPLCDLYQEPS